jgi:nitrogen PTS system EIIA component
LYFVLRRIGIPCGYKAYYAENEFKRRKLRQTALFCANCFIEVNLMTDRDIWTAKEVAEYVQVSERTVLDWAQKGEIPCGKLGNSWRFKRADVEAWLDQKLGAKPAVVETPKISLDDVLTLDRVLFLETPVKETVLDGLIDSLSEAGAGLDRDALSTEIFAREKLMSTGMGLGVAIPHVRLKSVEKTMMAAAVVASGMDDYESLDGQPVKLVFMIAAGHDQHAAYLRLLSSLANLVKDEGIRQRLIDANDGNEFLRILGQEN